MTGFLISTSTSLPASTSLLSDSDADSSDFSSVFPAAAFLPFAVVVSAFTFGDFFDFTAGSSSSSCSMSSASSVSFVGVVFPFTAFFFDSGSGVASFFFFASPLFAGSVLIAGSFLVADTLLVTGSFFFATGLAAVVLDFRPRFVTGSSSSSSTSDTSFSILTSASSFSTSSRARFFAGTAINRQHTPPTPQQVKRTYQSSWKYHPPSSTSFHLPAPSLLTHPRRPRPP
ncbi:hypothetical protein BZA05DRAFT_185480 [Tricharina praecox]|uniref:uncharacterized protein n=1 Tax=Tricharina praecox TaxID=43433 RepID=UPI00222061D0|nr:uncharacterized protein BZA05DRAFT_185480 [Tricharina praecox]KAI5843266.1 hypothetical protein BZA05DRAFT_185480 [Tricharina praecox]